MVILRCLGLLCLISILVLCLQILASIFIAVSCMDGPKREKRAKEMLESFPICLVFKYHYVKITLGAWGIMCAIWAMGVTYDIVTETSQ